MVRPLDPDCIAPSETDGDVLTTVGGRSIWRAATGGGEVATTALVPLTTTAAGLPQLVWDADDQLILTEVPL